MWPANVGSLRSTPGWKHSTRNITNVVWKYSAFRAISLVIRKYTYLKEARPGILGSEAIKWNFTKFLVGKDGILIERYAPTDKPESIAADVEAVLR